ncbi:MAG: hypothetical protein ONA69_04415 [candidate division KSB1 bacterium]|nr:hypothetical protein [candidate division KSB1 bacterium]MDZ7346019.1 hypothetical protein [candidate division KSB1 bacterium]
MKQVMVKRLIQFTKVILMMEQNTLQKCVLRPMPMRELNAMRLGFLMGPPLFITFPLIQRHRVRRICSAGGWVSLHVE